MKLLIRPKHLKLLESNFQLIEGKGLVQKDNEFLTETRMKEFLVKVWFQGWPTQIRVGASSPSSALAIARLMFPKARVTANITAV